MCPQQMKVWDKNINIVPVQFIWNVECIFDMHAQVVRSRKGYGY